MSETKVVMVVLRRPERLTGNDLDKRSDPFWEFASFGITGCHRDNLMNPKEAEGRLSGARLAFAQDGEDGWRLVFLSPCVRIVSCGPFCCEARWGSSDHPDWPFRYGDAPLLMDRDGNSEIPALRRLIKDADTQSWLLKFAAKFRSRTLALDVGIADELVRVYTTARETAGPERFARRYEEAILKNADGIYLDRSREGTYKKFADKWQRCTETTERNACGCEGGRAC